MCSMRPARNIHLEAYADASASGGKCTVGGFVQHRHLGQLWFSESFTATDFHGLDIPVQHDMSKDIASYETLAQGGLIFAASALLPCSRLSILLKSLSDNTGAEASLNAAFSIAQPLGMFIERLALLAAVHRVQLEVSHISGEKNTKTDALSRPDEHPVPVAFLSKD